eukprot:3539450-Prymnesium_polylepis.1
MVYMPWPTATRGRLMQRPPPSGGHIARYPTRGRCARRYSTRCGTRAATCFETADPRPSTRRSEEQ